MKKYKEITIEHFVHVYETMGGKKLSARDKKKVEKYALDLPKSLNNMSQVDLLLLREIRALQLEILDISECDELRILV